MINSEINRFRWWCLGVFFYGARFSDVGRSLDVAMDFIVSSSRVFQIRI